MSKLNEYSDNRARRLLVTGYWCLAGTAPGVLGLTVFLPVSGGEMIPVMWYVVGAVATLVVTALVAFTIAVFLENIGIQDDVFVDEPAAPPAPPAPPTPAPVVVTPTPVAPAPAAVVQPASVATLPAAPVEPAIQTPAPAAPTPQEVTL